jgi:tetratricopeptide (TPR) repeat protein
MAFGTGFVMGMMFNRFLFFLIPPISFPVVFGLIYQFIVLSYFWGRRRGAFEYSYLERSAERDSELKRTFKDVKKELKLGDPKAANLKLNEAINKFPNHFVAQFKYAVSCEKLGQTQEAILAYESAVNLLRIESKSLHDYVLAQAYRVRSKGPSTKTTAPGLQYVIY